MGCDAKPILWTRKQYMQGEVDHDTYYRQFVTEKIKKIVVQWIGLEEILASTDRSMNDIPLQKWDGMSPFVIRESARKLKEAGDVHAASLGNAVCVAKAAARAIKRENQGVEASSGLA